MRNASAAAAVTTTTTTIINTSKRIRIIKLFKQKNTQENKKMAQITQKIKYDKI